MNNPPLWQKLGVDLNIAKTRTFEHLQHSARENTRISSVIPLPR